MVHALADIPTWSRTSPASVSGRPNRLDAGHSWHRERPSHTSLRPVQGICRELRDRYRAFCSESLAELNVLALFLDAVYLPATAERE